MEENKIVNALRVMSVNAIENASSGHPGICLGAAPIFYAMYKQAFVVPHKPDYINRDRIVFSAGHASALIYSTLSLLGFDVSVDDIKKFRKLGSKTSGHPEVFLTPGVDVSTGPLGQGIANAVGFAMAEKYLADKFNKLNNEIISHNTYCFCGDGCLMEGVALEAISVAGNLALNKLILLYDKNNITIEGELEKANTEDVELKFKACNWNVLKVADANNVAEIEKAICKAKKSEDKPTIIIINSHIGFGCELQDNEKVHGSPLNKEQITKLKENLGYDEPDWQFPQDVIKAVSKLVESKNEVYQKQQEQMNEYKSKYPQEYAEFCRFLQKQEYDFSQLVSEFEIKRNSTREIANAILNKIKDMVPNWIGGSADLAPSTKITFNDESFFDAKTAGRNIHFGIREHSMGSICNGIALHGGLAAFCSTFFTFENYMTPAIRMSALMPANVTYFFTHDSIAVGEDGPTHQPVEQMATLRAMPNLTVFRPCGVKETLAGFQSALNLTNPVALILTRQKFDVVEDDFSKALKGAYVLKDVDNYQATLLCCGAEVDIACKVQEILLQKGKKIRIVSVPSLEIFEKQTEEYKTQILGDKKVFAMELSSDASWYKYVTNKNGVINLTEFSVTGNEHDLCEYFGFTPEKLANKFEKMI